METVKAYKLARPDGYDFYTGKTINYRENIGKAVKCPRANPALGVCSSGAIHASKNPNDCFVGAKIPCSAYLVEGTPTCRDASKWGFSELLVIKEIFDLDLLFGWKYASVLNPFNPLRKKRNPTKADIKLLQVWASIRDSIGASVGDSVGDSIRDLVGASVGDLVGASVWASIWASIRDSIWASIRDSIWASIRDSIWDSIWAYIGSLFPNVKKWEYIQHEVGKYPYQTCVDLWMRSLVPTFDGKVWRLHSGTKGAVVFVITKAELSAFK